MGSSMSPRGRLASFAFAARGLATMLRTQPNARIHLAATVAVSAAGAAFRICGAEWCLVAMAIAVVWVAEALNTAFESLADVSSPGFHPLVEKAKDVAAGGVLVTAIAAATVGAIVFAPHVAQALGAAR
jgi:diacylglycerol kinase (ATP)